jgi:hypothetical protein
MIPYRQYMYNRRLNEARASIAPLQNRAYDRYAAEFSQNLESATTSLTSQFDEFFGADTDRRNSFIQDLQTNIDLGNQSLSEVQAAEQDLLGGIRGGQVNRGNIATRAETARMRKALSNLTSLGLQEDTEETKVLDLFGNEVTLNDLDLNQRTNNRFSVEPQAMDEVDPALLQTVQQQYEEFRDMQDRDLPGSVVYGTEYGRLANRFGDRDPETMARLLQIYGDTDVSLAGIRDDDLGEFLNPEAGVRQQTYEQLNQAMDELERDELQRRFEMAQQREQQRIEKNRQIMEARDTFQSQAESLGTTLKKLGLTSEQLQARDDLSAEGSLKDTRSNVVVAAPKTNRTAPTFQQRPE